jgi:predicted glycoside hydrolase/deacetylase ChbG (UPF0249 family)
MVPSFRTMSSDRPSISLVVNADQFGAAPSVSHGILRAHREGIVTSTSVVGNCADPLGVKALLAEAPGLGVGVHLTLTGGAPVADPARVPSLLGADGRFPEHVRDHAMRWARRTLAADEIEREFDAQVARLRDLGLVLDHLDTSRHVGFVPLVGRAMEAVARRHGIAGLRTTVEGPSLSWVAEPDRGAMAALLGGLSWLTRRELGARRHGPQSWGFVESGQLDEVRILEILGRLGPGAHELICHPGDADDAPSAPAPSFARARELAALTAPIVRGAIERRGIALVRWADLF